MGEAAVHVAVPASACVFHHACQNLHVAEKNQQALKGCKYDAADLLKLAYALWREIFVFRQSAHEGHIMKGIIGMARGRVERLNALPPH